MKTCLTRFCFWKSFRFTLLLIRKTTKPRLKCNFTALVFFCLPAGRQVPMNGGRSWRAKVHNRARILKKIKISLDSERFKHSLRVEKTAVRLAKIFGENLEKASIAGLLHDCARRYNRKQLLGVARKIGLEIDPVRKFEPKLFHGEIGAYLARTEFGVRSAEILRAIRNHTTGAPRMSKLEKIIYLADHIEEGRNFPEVKRLRNLAFRNLDRAIFESTSAMLKFLLEKKLPIYLETIRTRNSFIIKT